MTESAHTLTLAVTAILEESTVKIGEANAQRLASVVGAALQQPTDLPGWTRLAIASAQLSCVAHDCRRSGEVAIAVTASLLAEAIAVTWRLEATVAAEATRLDDFPPSD